MEHAVGADHLIYGWVFFSLVIVCLLGIGELIREKQVTAVTSQVETTVSAVFSEKTCYQATSSIVALMLLFLVWFTSINNQLNVVNTEHNLSATLVAEQEASTDIYTSAWKPEFNLPYQEFQFLRELNNVPVDVYLVWYPKGHGELISSLNRLYPEKAWTLESQSSYPLQDEQSMGISTIVNPRGKRLLSYWYIIDGKVFTNNRMAKLYEIYRILIGSYVGSGLVAISQVTSNTSEQQDTLSFAELTQDNLFELNQYFDFE
jgi:EpsI family protein